MRKWWHLIAQEWGNESLLEELPARHKRAGAPGPRPARRRRRVQLRVGVICTALCLAIVGIGSSATPSTFSWSSPQSVDTQYPYSNPFSVNSLSCSSSTLCIGTTAVNAEIITSTDPTGSSTSDWSVLPTSLLASGATGYSLAGGTCVTVSSGPLCVGTGTDPSSDTDPGLVLTSTNPTGGAGAWTHQDDALAGFEVPPSCAQTGATTICIGSNSFPADAFVSTDPSGGASSWHQFTLAVGEAEVVGVACVSTSMCAGLGNDGLFVSSTNPTNPDSWSGDATGLTSAVSLSCPTASFCLAYGTNSDSFPTVATTTDPQAGANAIWTTNTTGALSDVPGPIDCSPDPSLPNCGVSEFATERSHFSTQRWGCWLGG
ncbi:MAG: hypothetical protein ACLPZR_01150 [Solirubrobacteraceae bacterium]